ncbi:uncharacterized protein BDZ83DRAFT_602667 [Colletotrichum acutatum]|uniref:Uncharacterized protein n=1 Tax=Glomerella acutata TaxID=27357 RepID=A0AAD8XMY4_GLOAC|nr:uncharacterized protein BDZ83DRAFT_602667 [Colletotrichum acutatum]KAK1730412.1 hypothetical protein BDZ83DRAFT_602667 [Colletotrichum acutatum]
MTRDLDQPTTPWQRLCSPPPEIRSSLPHWDVRSEFPHTRRCFPARRSMQNASSDPSARSHLTAFQRSFRHLSHPL